MDELGYSLSSDDIDPLTSSPPPRRAEVCGFGFAVISDHNHFPASTGRRQELLHRLGSEAQRGWPEGNRWQTVGQRMTLSGMGTWMAWARYLLLGKPRTVVWVLRRA